MQSFQFFDPAQEVSIVANQLPHWSQAGTLVFITWRTANSLPRTLQDELTRERDQTLRRMGLDPRGDWQAAVEQLSSAERGRAKSALFETWDGLLDRGGGACVLQHPEIAAIVEASLLHFDNKRYYLTDAVVMPNHVHLLAAFSTEDAMLAQCESWKRYTARQINQRLCQSGEFWQVEPFDHLVRSED